MSERDDDFLDHGGEEFNPDADEFQIPDDPHSEDDFLSQEDEGFDLSEDDVLDMSGTDESDLFADGDDFSLDDPDETDEAGGDIEHQEEVYYEDDEDEGPAPDNGIGWKAWAGIALVAITAAGGLGYWAMPQTAEQPSVSAETRTLPTPPPAPEEPAKAQQSRAATDAQQPPVTAQQRRARSPVEVSPFPEPQAVEEIEVPTESVAGAPDIPDDVEGIEPTAQDQMMPAVAQPDVPSNPTPPRSGGNGNGGPDSETLMAPPVDVQVERSRRTQPTVVPDTASTQVEDREPRYIQALQEQRKAFSVLMDMTKDNGRQIANVRGDLNDYRQETKRDIRDLDSRVGQLERMIEQDAKPMKPNNAGQHGGQPSQRVGSNDASSKTPKSPREVKALQETLKDHGYRPGPVDGIFGGQTRWAIKRLQEEHGLEKTGWLNDETLAALSDPKQYSGNYDEQDAAKTADREPARGSQQAEAVAQASEWFVRGVTPVKAILYRPDGMSYVVKVGSEIPGMGQVTALDPEKLHVITPKGVITRR